MLFKKKIIPAELVSLELRYNENRSKLVRVFVPEHKKGEKLPVIYMTDGQSVFDEESNPLGCWHTREAVAAEKAATGKAAIIVGIHSDPNPMLPYRRECRLCPRECRPCLKECRLCPRECRPCLKECRLCPKECRLCPKECRLCPRECRLCPKECRLCPRE